MFQFELLTKRDWAFVAAVTLVFALIAASGLYWLVVDYTSMSLSADHGRLGRY